MQALRRAQTGLASRGVSFAWLLLDGEGGGRNVSFCLYGLTPASSESGTYKSRQVCTTG
jgi:hypothetical protein